MTALNLTESIISTIVDNPSLLSSSTELHTLGVTQDQATYILAHGYTQGFRSVFILNAALAAVAAVVSMIMIQHTELLRGDEEELRAEARAFLKRQKGGEEKAGNGAKLEGDKKLSGKESVTVFSTEIEDASRSNSGDAVELGDLNKEGN